VISDKVHFGFIDDLTKSEKDETKGRRREPVISLSNTAIIWHSFGDYGDYLPICREESKEKRILRKRNVLKSGPMRGTRVHLTVHSHLHGLTRSASYRGAIFKFFTFTDPMAGFIRKENNIGRKPREFGAGDDIMICEKSTSKGFMKNPGDNPMPGNERKLNIGEKCKGIIETYILVRGASLRKEALGKPPIQIFPEGRGHAV